MLQSPDQGAVIVDRRSGSRLPAGGPDLGSGDDPGNDRAGDQDEAKAQHGSSFLKCVDLWAARKN
jgi:hypothetical protein